MSSRAYPARWPVAASGPVAGTVRPPGSKSLTNRALVAAGLASGTSRLVSPLESDDTEAMRACLAQLGVVIEPNGVDLVVHGPDGLTSPGARLDARASGTTARFVTAVAATASGPSTLDGTSRMRERPIGPLVDALRALGAEIDYAGAEGFPPLRIAGGGLRGGRATVDASDSSQFVSALLLAAPTARQTTVLELSGPIVSRPYIDNTIEVMARFGASARWTGPDQLIVASGGYTACDYAVEPDASAAVYPWAAAAVTGGRMTVAGLAGDSAQADMGALAVLERMGCRVERTADGVTVEGPPQLAGVEADMVDCPDAVLGIAVVAAFATGPSYLTNIGNLRIKETDRLYALETELRRLGCDATAGDDWLEVRPAPLRGGVVETYDDHRMAMAFAIAGLAVPGIEIDDPGCVAKTWPGFFEWLEAL